MHCPRDLAGPLTRRVERREADFVSARAGSFRDAGVADADPRACGSGKPTAPVGHGYGLGGCRTEYARGGHSQPLRIIGSHLGLDAGSDPFAAAAEPRGASLDGANAYPHSDRLGVTDSRRKADADANRDSDPGSDVNANAQCRAADADEHPVTNAPSSPDSDP